MAKNEARDSKTGEFKKSGGKGTRPKAAGAKGKSKKHGPDRDPETGEFVKTKGAKKHGRDRDPETGEFVKAKGAKKRRKLTSGKKRK